MKCDHDAWKMILMAVLVLVLDKYSNIELRKELLVKNTYLVCELDRDPGGLIVVGDLI